MKAGGKFRLHFMIRDFLFDILRFFLFFHWHAPDPEPVNDKGQALLVQGTRRYIRRQQWPGRETHSLGRINRP